MRDFLIQLREALRAIKMLFVDFMILRRGLKDYQLSVSPKFLHSWTSKVIFLSHNDINRQLFIKVYNSNATREKKIGDHFQSIEEHPFVFPIKCIKMRKYSIYVFNYQPGITLKEAIEKGSKKELNYFLNNIHNVLTQMKKYGIVHCDLTPQNLIIHQDRYIKVIDFEFAIITDHLTLSAHEKSQEIFLKNLGGNYKTQDNFSNENFISNILILHKREFKFVNPAQYELLAIQVSKDNE